MERMGTKHAEMNEEGNLQVRILNASANGLVYKAVEEAHKRGDDQLQTVGPAYDVLACVGECQGGGVCVAALWAYSLRLTGREERLLRCLRAWVAWRCSCACGLSYGLQLDNGESLADLGAQGARVRTEKWFWTEPEELDVCRGQQPEQAGF